MNIFTPVLYEASVAVYVQVDPLDVIATLASASPVPLPTDMNAAHDVMAVAGVYDTVNDVPVLFEIIIVPLVPVTALPPPAAPLTVIVVVAVLPPAVAVMTALPAERPVTSPPDDTEAQVSPLVTAQVTVLLVAFDGATVAVRVIVLPTVTLVSPAIVTPVTATVGVSVVPSLLPEFVVEAAVTVMAYFVQRLPAAALTSAVPAAMPVTVPLSTDAYSLPLNIDHVTVLSVASSGDTVAVSVSVLPASTVLSPVIFMLVTATPPPLVLCAHPVRNARIEIAQIAPAILLILPSLRYAISLFS
jgi:hypothetical protein